jgi:glycosyltransferase involved in cell wall biosynthesis
MRILLFHPTLLPPRNYGGVERVLLWLAKGLVERGHQVFVAALPGSKLPLGCELVEVEEKAYSARELNFNECDSNPRSDDPLNSRLNLRMPASLDMIHFMAPVPSDVWTQLKCPAILTVHGNAKPGECYPKNSVFLSQDHARRHGAQKFIYNGIDPVEYQFTPKAKKEAYLFLSKTNWRVKNLAGAIRYCSAAGVPLKISGGSRPLFTRFSCLFRPHLTWMGPVSGKPKAKLLAEAKAFIFPVAWPEPFGLVVAEALISGTPVLASRKGSLPELIPPDVGALLDTDEEWVEFLSRGTLPWEPERCRSWALEQFHYAKMAEAYELAYKQVVAGELLNQEVPVGGNWRDQ